METRRRRLRAALILGAGALVTTLVLVLTLTDALRQPELDTVDARFAIGGRPAPPADGVDVPIDDVSFDELGKQWPFPRGMHAVGIDRLRRAGAKGGAYDIQFTEPSDDQSQDDALIAAATRAGRRLVLATSEVNEFGESAVFGTADTVRATGAQVGNTVIPADEDGVIRRVPYAIDKMKSFSVTAAEAAQGRPVSRNGFSGNSAWIGYHGAPGAIPSVSFSRVYNNQVDPATFRGKVVVVGMSAPSQQDVHPTSVSGEEMMSGAEIQANAISTLLRGVPLRPAPDWLAAALVVLFGMLCPLAALKRGGRGLPICVAVVVAYPLVALLAFRTGLILPLVYPLLAVATSAIAVLGIAYVTAAFERERVRERFTRFVPETIVDEVINDDLCLGGRRLQATVMFCDIRGFTDFAELRPAEQVIEVLNRYLSEMSEAVRAQGGTLLRYEGDGIYAGFGLPIEQIDHADRALDAVRDMAGARLDRVNEWVRSEGLGDGFRIGIGVDSGVVMSGNVGCDWRMEYMAIGDTVNTACRLEELTKSTEHQVLISDNTRAMLRTEAPELQYVDAQSIRGKQVKVVLWTLNGVHAEGRAVTADQAGQEGAR